MEALVERIASGPESLFSEKQRQTVKKWILGKDPRQYGFDYGLWSRRIVQALIQEKMGIECGLTAVGRLLASLNITPQKPLRRAYERDPVAVAVWERGDLSQAPKTGQTAWGEHFLFGRGRLSIRPGARTNLWTQRTNASGQDFRSASKPQRHQRRQCSRGILGGNIHWQIERGIVRAFLAEFYGDPDRQKYSWWWMGIQRIKPMRSRITSNL